MSDEDLQKRLITVLTRFIDDQASDSPRYTVSNIPSELHGELADLLLQDKVKNQLLVSMLIGLFTGRPNRTDDEIIQLLHDVKDSLASVTLLNDIDR